MEFPTHDKVASTASEEVVIGRMLSVLQQDVLPMTEAGVGRGNKVFGAAILRKVGLGLVVAGTNDEINNPLLHGEMSCLNTYWAMPRDSRPAPRECLFLSTHEPCSMCLSAITWSGFDNIHFLFSHEDSRDSFNIPHDLRILEEVFACAGGAYRRSNSFWTCHDLRAMIGKSRSNRVGGWLAQVDAIGKEYERLSEKYQDSKGHKGIPLD